MQGLSTYRTYSITAFAVWAGALPLVAMLVLSPAHDQQLIVFFLGWTIGWVSTTIARSVYPPPGDTPRTPPAAR